MGTLGASLDPGGLDVSDTWDRHGLLLGLLHSWLGWMVVLGPCRKRFVHAMARRHRASSFGGRHGKTPGVENLDDSAGDPHFFAFASWYLPRAVRRADIGSR